MTSQPNAPFTPRRRSHMSAAPQAATRRFRRWKVLVIIVALCVIGAGWQVLRRDEALIAPEKVVQKAPTRTGFPTLNTSQMTARQQRVVALAKQEYLKNPVRYDAAVKTYTEGFEESWCADFISWVFYKAGVGYEHPETGYWRIPGVQTLATYYRELGAYHTVGGGYVPKLGDVAFYFGETPDGGSAEHVAMVLAVEGDRVITIGGNETDRGILQVRHDKIDTSVKGLTAFGASGI